MNCQDYEPLIALYVERDVEDPVLERHLVTCSPCRELLEDLRASQTAVREMRLSRVDPAFLTAVRSGVLAEIGGRRRVWPPWIAAVAMVLVAMVVLLAPHRPVSTAREPKTEPLVVKMLTDDPNVVIIWLVDQTGD